MYTMSSDASDLASGERQPCSARHAVITRPSSHCVFIASGLLQVPMPVIYQYHVGKCHDSRKRWQITRVHRFQHHRAATARRCRPPRIHSPSTLRANTSTPQLKYPECVRHAAEQFKQQVGYPLTGRSSSLPHGRTTDPAVYLQQLQHAGIADQQLCLIERTPSH
jgi:hypothetical protein